jgi:glycosyltransferase involved in cell wall biosynthesis
MKISSCLIAKNEAENISRCLESIKSISNEIIVVDTGSTDNTVEIAKSFGARVFFYEWDNNFSNAKNYALDKATGDWIIFLDADEYLEENTQKNLISVLKRVYGKKEFDGVLCKMVNIERLSGRVISENPILRIFRGNVGIRYIGAIHEYPVKSGESLKAASINDTSLIIYHTGYSSDILSGKTRRNLEILEDQISKGFKDDKTYYYMSSMNWNLGNHEETIKYALLALEEPGLEKTIVAYMPYIFLILSMLKLQDKYPADEIDKYVDESISKYPVHPEIWYARGKVKMARKDYTGAIQSYQKALECNRNFNLLMNNSFPSHLEEVYLDLAESYLHTGENVRALDCYYEALKSNKWSVNALEGLYGLIRTQQPAEIIFFLSSIYKKDNKEDLVFLNTSMAKLGDRLLANYYYEAYKKADQ